MGQRAGLQLLNDFDKGNRNPNNVKSVKVADEAEESSGQVKPGIK